MIIGIALVAVLAVFSVLSVMQILALQDDNKTHMENVTIISEQVAEYEAEIERAKGSDEEIVLLLAEVKALKDQIRELTSANKELTEENEELASANEELVSENDELTSANTKLAASNKDLTAANSELEKQKTSASNANGNTTKNLGTNVGEKFKLTFYTTEGSYDHLVPGKTVAMNADQVAALGLKKGDEIYVISQKGWSGYYTITDHGCAEGIIDIYVNRADIPHWGVEYGVEILI